MTAQHARVVQISDTHFSRRGRLAGALAGRCRLAGAPTRPTSSCTPATSSTRIPTTTTTGPSPRPLLDADRRRPYVVIPGNHDIGFYDEEPDGLARIDAFRATWGDDRFVRDLAGWRLVGVDTYLLGTPEHDDVAARRVATDGPVMVFVHQPLRGDPVDGWEMPAPPRERVRARRRRRRRARRRLRPPPLLAPRRPGGLGPVADADQHDPTPAPTPAPGSSSTASPRRRARAPVVRPWTAQSTVSTTAITTPLKMAWASIVGPIRRSR